MSDEDTYLLGTPTRSNHNFHYGEALMHLVKSYVGTGIFCMGDAMKNSGLLLGPPFVILIGVVCLHCCHLLVNNADLLQKHFNLERIPDYADTMKYSFLLACPNYPHLSIACKFITNITLVMAQVGFCCCYLVFISWNIHELLKAFDVDLDIHSILPIITIPVWLTCLIRTLKVLSRLSIVANVILLTSILAIIYHTIAHGGCSVDVRIPKPDTFAIFFGQSVFAFEGIGLVLILYNEIDDKEEFKSAYGVLNMGVIIVTFLYMGFGTMTYLGFGNDIQETVTLNLDKRSWLGQIVLLLISIGVAFSFALQLYVAIDILFPRVVYWFGPFDYPCLVELWFRTALVITIFVLAEAVPKLQLLLSFFGSVLSTALIAIFPVVIDMVTKYGMRSASKWAWGKNLLLLGFAVVATVAGTYESLVLLSKEL